MSHFFYKIEAFSLEIIFRYVKTNDLILTKTFGFCRADRRGEDVILTFQ